MVLHYRLPSSGPSQPRSPASAAPARVGFVVSRAVGGAVIRNRVKRRLRHLLAARLSILSAGSLLVVRALPAASTLEDRVAQDVESALISVGAL